MALATTTAKPTAVSVGDMPKSDPRATPPKAECATPTPTKDNLRRTTKKETTAKTRLSIVPAKKAFCINSRSKISIMIFMPMITCYTFRIMDDNFHVLSKNALLYFRRETGVGLTMIVKLNVEACNAIRM